MSLGALLVRLSGGWSTSSVCVKMERCVVMSVRDREMKEVDGELLLLSAVVAIQ